jgi:hypothetical protein
MRATVLMGSLFLAAAMTAASAATYVPVVPASGSTSMKIQGINDKNEIAGGYYTADGIEHGFVGTADGTYQTFDLGARFTEPHHINNMGMMVGDTDDAGVDGVNLAFERSARTGKTVYIKVRHALMQNGQAYGINDQGVVVGYGVNPEVSGYYALKGRYTGSLTISQSSQVEPRGINASNVVVGTYLDATVPGYVSHGFILQGGVSTQIDYPGAVGTELNDINDSGMAVGEWYDTHGRPHPFKYDTVTTTFKTLRPPGTGYGRAWAINGHGLIALYSSDDVSSFIYCPRTKGCPTTGGAAARGR